MSGKRVNLKEIDKQTDRYHRLLFSLQELDSYTDNLVGKVLTLLEAFIENQERLKSAKSVAREYLYSINSSVHGSINDHLAYLEKNDEEDMKLQLPFHKFVFEETDKERRKILREIVNK